MVVGLTCSLGDWMRGMVADLGHTMDTDVRGPFCLDWGLSSGNKVPVIVRGASERTHT